MPSNIKFHHDLSKFVMDRSRAPGLHALHK